ncbi:sulfate adenylyltransferase subunit CysN [Zavarzinella formosa]|uniref:sulfate adenylyltransferase subunit CysN n=1 Tax=Zavarzinella formosa TaxID=360055 RepID=UPI0003154D40|nr:sulfate adenylyltransferase subunit CysN [Zavarzinella formosa]
MAHVSDLIATDIDAYLKQHETKSLLRFITCGSVDDGKSTLIGRLLYESKMLFEDQLASLVADSKKVGTRGGEIDYALLLDGLAAEREQGITIDVAYRFFSTDRRKFIVADTPGHEQYTRNMVTGASTADLAIILIDARKGVLVQTRRHSYLVSLIGIRHVVLAINKMDLVDYSQETFDKIVAEYRGFAEKIGLQNIHAMPISGVHGDNIVDKSPNTPWYSGPTLMHLLETVAIDEERLQMQPFRLPVQWVNRPNLDFRGFAGTITGGVIRPGERIRVMPSGRETTVTRIVTATGDLDHAVANQSITLTLADEVDISRGDLLCPPNAPSQVADAVEATVVWMAEQPMLRGRSYFLKIGPKTVTATVMPLRHKVNVNTLEQTPAEKLELNEIGVCELELDRPVPFDPYTENRDTGGFILVDRITNNTVGAGMIRASLKRSTKVDWQAIEVNKQAQALLKGQTPAIVWFTGISGAGKLPIAKLVQKKLFAEGRHTFLLESNIVRHGLNKDLGFDDVGVVENIRRSAEVAKLMTDAGLIVLAVFISPFRSERRAARAMMPPGEFIEVFIDTPMEVAESRDEKGLYRKARSGELENFTGIDSPYEKPEEPDIHIDTTTMSHETAAERIVADLRQRGILDRDRGEPLF